MSFTHSFAKRRAKEWIQEGGRANPGYLHCDFCKLFTHAIISSVVGYEMQHIAKQPKNSLVSRAGHLAGAVEAVSHAKPGIISSIAHINYMACSERPIADKGAGCRDVAQFCQSAQSTMNDWFAFESFFTCVAKFNAEGLQVM